MWELKTGACLSVLLGHGSTVNNIDFHPILNLLISASDDGTSRIWNLDTLIRKEGQQDLLEQAPPALEACVIPHSNPQANQTVKVRCMSISPVGGYFATGGDDGIGRVWSIDEDIDGLLEVAGDGAGASAGSRAGLRSSSQSAGQNLPSGLSRLICKLQGHLSTISDITYSRKGDRLATGSMADGSARIWRWKKGYTDLQCRTVQVRS